MSIFLLVLVLLLHYTNARGLIETDEGNWSTNTEIANNLIINSDESDCESTYCEKVDSHQTKIIESMLGRTLTDIKKFKELFGEDELIPKKIALRHDLPPYENELCESQEKLVYPSKAKSINDKWHLLPNNEIYKQGIRVELCLNSTMDSTDKRSSTTGLPKCKMMDNFPQSYSSECTQKYIYRHLVALDAEEMKWIKEKFMLPSCCQCVLIQTK